TYVVDVDAAANRVVVGPGEMLERRGLVADRVSWVAGRAPADGPFETVVRLRYRGDDVAAVVEAIPSSEPPLRGASLGPTASLLEAEGDRLRVEFRTPQRGVAPGQSVVVYRGDELLGGARIVESIR
ncbi:MAG: aminomethyltransferase beta-barrel domain-containing protein, partial [Actinomycetota bacterium]